MYRALYWIWNEKSHMLKLVVELNIFQSTYFAWIDIGAVRYNIYQCCWTLTAGTATFALVEPEPEYISILVPDPDLVPEKEPK